jgi:hypothetical protein
MRRLLMGLATLVIIGSAVCFNDTAAASAQSAEEGPFTTGGSIARCPDGYFLSAVQGIKRRWAEISAMAIWCRPLFTSGSVPTDHSEKGPFVTNEPRDYGEGKKVSCPTNYFVSAFQLLVAGDRLPQRSIHIWCRPLLPMSEIPADNHETMLTTGPEPLSSGKSERIEIQSGYFVAAQISEAFGGGDNPRTLNVWTRPFLK